MLQQRIKHRNWQNEQWGDVLPWRTTLSLAKMRFGANACEIKGIQEENWGRHNQAIRM